MLLLLCSCAVNTGAEAGRINGTNIRNDEFVSAYRGHYSNFSFQNGRSPDKEEKQKIFNETWKNITRYVVLKDYYKKYKISTNMREVLDTLSTNIPQHILNSPVFKVNGKFDKQLYLQSLTTDRPENLAPLRKHYLENLIPIMKLKEKLIENELITPKESKHIARILSSKADMELMIFDPGDLKVYLSDAEIAEYYNSTITRYSLKPYHRLAYTLIPVVPVLDDQQMSHAMADSVLSLLNNGTMAEDIIHNTTSSSGQLSMVDYGYVKTIDIPEDIAFLLSTMADGTYSQVLKSDLGWAIHHKVQSTKTLTHYRTLYIQTVASSATLATPEVIANRVASLAKNIGLADAANEFDLAYTLSDTLYGDSLGFIASDIKPTLLAWLAKADKGALSKPLYSSDLSAWIIVEAAEIQRQTAKPISEVKDLLTNELTKIRKAEINQQMARNWAASGGKDSVGKPQSVLLKNVSMDSYWEGQALDKVYYQAVYAHMAKNELPVVNHNAVLIVPIVTSLRFEKVLPEPEQIRNAYISTLEDDWFNKWLETKVKAAKVQILNAP
jgi:sulfur relay (sulfurtransferase) DsrC/TusE family protein